MAPRKKTQKPADETPDVTNAEPDTVTASDDSLADTPGADSIAASETGEDTVSSDVTLVAPQTASIELPEPDRESPETDDSGDTPDEAATEEVVAMPDDDTADDEPSADADETDDQDPTDAFDFDALPPPPPQPERRGGFVPLALGGLVAGAIGFGAATILGVGNGPDLTARLDAQDAALADIKSSIPDIPDTSGIESASAANTTSITDLTTRLDDLSTAMTALEDRMTGLEKAAVENVVSDAAMKAYEDELARLQAAMQTQRQEVETMVTRAQEMNAQADAEAARTEARAALTQILLAFDSGESYVDHLQALKISGQQVPAPLEDNADGIPTLAELRDSFPAAARAALAATRGAGTGTGSVGDFFKTQLGVRSLSPQEGDSPDAVLSRVEAAVSDGDLSAALEEISALPPEAQAPLADWSAAAETRLSTVKAANGLMADLNSN